MMSGPSLAEVRAKGQPPEVLARLNDEHWFGRLYMRRLSPYATVLFARLGWSPNAVTVCFMISGAAAGVLAAVPGLPAAVGVALLIQLYLLFDCSDGELARLTNRFSATGIYLDRMGHYIAEALLLAGLGVRAQGHFSLAGGYVSAGLAAAICATLIKAETDTVVVARASSGLDGKHDDQALTPRSEGSRWPGGWHRRCALHRIIQAVELSVLILVAAIADAATGTLTATRVLDRGGAGGGRGHGGRRTWWPSWRPGACDDQGYNETRDTTLSCVILTMGDRPAEVIRAIDSVLAQRGAQVELVVVGNGAEVTGLPAGVRAVWLPENVGVAAGRNAGVQACGGDVVLFLDDDGWYPEPRARRPRRGPVRRRPGAGGAVHASGRPRRRPGRPVARAAAAGRGPGPLLGRDDVPRRGVRDQAFGLPGGGRPARISSSTGTRRPTWPGG